MTTNKTLYANQEALDFVKTDDILKDMCGIIESSK